jgi:hypothetical protein
MILAAELFGTFAADLRVRMPLHVRTAGAELSGRPAGWLVRMHSEDAERFQKPWLRGSPDAPWLTALTAAQFCPPVIT